MSKTIMIQGTGSNVGKSLLVAGLCRAFRNRGYEVRPFKPQNMSNNAAVTEDGGEIGRAQALQAVAAGAALVSDLNPVLLKPESEIGSQVILQGKRLAIVKAQDYATLRPRLLSAVMASYQRVRHDVDLVIVEGAGSPAEINLRQNDIANMGFAEAANVPVILTGDIDRGGVIAQLVGTHEILPKSDRDRIKGFIINKFRGDPALFEPGFQEIVTRTGWHSIGMVPWFAQAASLPAEDAMDISSSMSGRFKIAVPCLSRIANFDDLDPLKLEPSVTVEIIKPGVPLPADANLVLIPGTKSTIADLAFFREQGWDIDLAGHIRRGGHVLGICGGYQMLGQEIADPDGIEGAPSVVRGLGHLDVVTKMQPEKRLANVTAEYLPTGQMLDGYEIHIGKTTGPDSKRAWLEIDGHPAGSQSENGRVMGCYLHGIFASDGFRKAYLASFGVKGSRMLYSVEIDRVLDSLAAHLESSLDLELLLDIAH